MNRQGNTTILLTIFFAFLIIASIILFRTFRESPTISPEEYFQRHPSNERE